MKPVWRRQAPGSKELIRTCPFLLRTEHVLGAGNRAMSTGRKRPFSLSWKRQGLGSWAALVALGSGKKLVLLWDNDIYAQGRGDSVTMETPRPRHWPCPQEASIRAGEKNPLCGGSKERGTGPLVSISGGWSRGQEVRGEIAVLTSEMTG